MNRYSVYPHVGSNYSIIEECCMWIKHCDLARDPLTKKLYAFLTDHQMKKYWRFCKQHNLKDMTIGSWLRVQPSLSTQFRMIGEEVQDVPSFARKR